MGPSKKADGDDQTDWRKDLPRWLTGYFLISEVELEDPHFRRTVILLVEHNKEGALGIVVNRQLEVTLSQVLPEYSDSAAGQLPLYQGGPVHPQYLFTIHSGFPTDLRSDKSSSPIENVVFEPAFPVLEAYLKEDWAALPEGDRPPINLYAGYAGWGGGQLENELDQGAWVVRPAAAKHVFSETPDEGWREALGELGGMHKIIAETGFKPSMN